MYNKEITENVDIYELPPVDDKYKTQVGAEFTIGDAHGSAPKVLFLLAKHGFAKNITPDDYKKFVTFCSKTPDEITLEDIEAYNKFLSSIEFNVEGSIRFLGDFFCERSMNDYPLLKLLEIMRKNGVRHELLFSNHDLEFIEAYENFGTRGQLVSQRLNQTVGRSLINLNALLEKKLIDSVEIFTIIDTVYKPALKLLSYSTNVEKDSFTLYSHAGIDLEVVKCIAEKWNIPYGDESIDELAKTIDVINEKFLEYVTTNTVHQLYNHHPVESTLAKAGNGQPIHPNEDPIIFTVWNRFYEQLNRPLKAKAGFALYFVHGHDQHELSHENIFNLDNDLGKDIDLSKGKYFVLLSVKSQYNLENQLEEKKAENVTVDREIEGFEGPEENISNALSALASFHETSDSTDSLSQREPSEDSIIVKDFFLVSSPMKNPTPEIAVKKEEVFALEKIDSLPVPDGLTALQASDLKNETLPSPIPELTPIILDKRESESESNEAIIIGDIQEPISTRLVEEKKVVLEAADSITKVDGDFQPKLKADLLDLELLFEPRLILPKNKRHALGEGNEMDYSQERSKKYIMNSTEMHFLNKLKKIKKKGEELQDNFFEDSEVARELHRALRISFYNYKENIISLEEFKFSSKEAIQKARPVLETHRGFKEILGNFALFIGMLGIGFVIAGLVNLARTDGKEFLFYKFETDSGKKLNNLEEAVDKIAPNL